MFVFLNGFSELTCIILALPFIKEKGFYLSKLPNKINFELSYHTFCLIGIFMYVPVFPQLYFYMLSQRRKYLGGSRKAKSA